jgi:hypothetical protein
VEPDVAAQVEAICHEVQIALDLLLRGEQLGPGPLLLDLGREAVAVLHALDVAASAGIPVEQPRTADLIGTLEDAGPQADLAHLVQRVEPGEPRSDHDDVELVGHDCHSAALTRSGRRRP